jgi:hypothetical protein
MNRTDSSWHETQPWYETFALLLIGPIGWLVLYFRANPRGSR